jgi:membrane protein
VVGTAALLLLSLAASTVLSGVAPRGLGLHRDAYSWRPVEMVVSVLLHAVIFATLFRVIPHANVRWRDVLGGALVTSIAFTAMKLVLGWYLSGIGSYAAYGAVGALLALLTWIYVAALVMFYGAELCHVYAARFGSMRKGAAPERS